MNDDPSSLDDLVQLYNSVTRLPELADHNQLWSVILRHKPDKLRPGGASARVLLSLSLSEEGEVLAARGTTPDASKAVAMRGIMMSEDGEYLGDIPDTTADAEIVAAAEAACLELTFRPAERDGTAVPFPDYRISIEFPGWHAPSLH